MSARKPRQAPARQPTPMRPVASVTPTTIPTLPRTPRTVALAKLCAYITQHYVTLAKAA